MTDIKPSDAIRLDIVEIKKSGTYPAENVPDEFG